MRFEVSFQDRRVKGHITVTVAARSATSAAIRARVEAANLAGHNSLTHISTKLVGEADCEEKPAH